MKKRFIILFFISILLHFQSLAQVKWGYKVGLGSAINSFNGSTTTAKSLLSYHLGIVNETSIDEKFAIQPSVFYIKKGYAEAFTSFPIHYIEAPVLLTYKPSPNYQLGIGPVFSFLLSSYFTRTKNFDFGANISGAYYASERTALSLNYTFSLGNINESGSDVRNRVINFSIIRFVDLSDLYDAARF
jgi:Outer membrane protein beta-barrel domain